MAAPSVATATNSQSSLAKFVQELTVNATHNETETGEGEVVRILQQLLATSGEANPKPKPNPVEKALNTDVRTLVAKASLAYPVLRAAAADPALRAMMISELVSLSLEDGGGVVLPVGLRTHPLPINEWKDFKENLAGLNARNLPHVQA